MKTDEKRFGALKRQLALYNKIAKENYRGKRTAVVLSGLNFNLRELNKTPYLHKYEEKFLFFLFLLRFSRTKIIYVTSERLPDYILSYYLDIITDDPQKQKRMLKRLILLNLNDRRKLPVAAKLAKNEEALQKITTEIPDRKNAYINCYNSTKYEKDVALKLKIPIYGINENLSVHGTKSGSIKIFGNCNVPFLNSYINLKSKKDLISSIAKLIKTHSDQKRLIIKIDDYPAGEGNVVFSIENLRKLAPIDNEKFKTIALAVEANMDACCEQSEKLPHNRFSYYFDTLDQYIEEFEKNGGIVELFADAKEMHSPSCQVRILPDKKVRILSTHEQILKGKYKSEYVGCIFPAGKDYRKNITSYSEKIGAFLAKKGVIGRFAVDFLAYRDDSSDPFKIKAIEINLRKGGTTHPYALARSATGALYNKKTGLLRIGSKYIYYLASDSISNEKWKNKQPQKLLKIIEANHLNYNKENKKGVIVHLSGTLKSSGRFGATFIGTSPKMVQDLYKKTLKILTEQL